jgi:hypothetical protein
MLIVWIKAELCGCFFWNIICLEAEVFFSLGSVSSRAARLFQNIVISLKE